MISQDENKTISYQVATIKMGDVEDPDLLVAQPIYEWQKTEAGKYVMENSVPRPSWTRHMDHMTYGYKYIITAYFTPKKLTYYKLRFE